ncbi:MAG: GNAT family N-acetyltransferase [Oscillospiraceae bacterium]
MEILKIREHPELAERAAQWYHSKWGIPLNAYVESISDCLKRGKSVPQWYLAMENGEIVGGLGVIENDFHERKDLAPNVCAVYTEKEHRCKGIAGKLLNFVSEDMEKFGIDTLYLLTDHTSFYERYGWEFLCMVREEGDEEETARCYVHRAKPSK